MTEGAELNKARVGEGGNVTGKRFEQPFLWVDSIIPLWTLESVNEPQVSPCELVDVFLLSWGSSTRIA